MGRATVNQSRTIPAIYHHLEKTGRLDAWRVDPNRERSSRRSEIYMFRDSDSAKWQESMA